MALRISIGADPELILRDRETKQYVSAHNLLPGTKLKPHEVSDPKGPFGAIQVDGVAAEFNTNPQFSASGFSDNISKVLGVLQNTVGDKYELISEPSVTFPEDYFKSLPEHVRELGCNPDFDAYSGQVTDKPDGGSTTMRTFAGHIHIGGWYNGDPTDDTHFNDCRIIARNLDYYLGLYSLQWDQDTSRRKLYGRAGCFRPKPYGIEYRPLSNVWLRTTALQQWVFNAAQKCMKDLLVSGTRADEEFGDLAKTFINTSEVWWTPEAIEKSKDHKKLASQLSTFTGLKNPPPIPKDNPSLNAKIAQKAEPKYKYTNAKQVHADYFADKITAAEANSIIHMMKKDGII